MSAVQPEAVLGGEPGNGIDVEVDPEPLPQGLPCGRVWLGARGEEFAQPREVLLESPWRDDLQDASRRIASVPERVRDAAGLGDHVAGPCQDDLRTHLGADLPVKDV